MLLCVGVLGAVVAGTIGYPVGVATGGVGMRGAIPFAVIGGFCAALGAKAALNRQRLVAKT